MGELLRQLDYKATWYGATLIKADRTYPSTRACSTCGTVKANLSLTTRTYQCDHCGLSLDRDTNAAINLAQHAAKAVSGDSWRGGHPGPSGWVRHRRSHAQDPTWWGSRQ